jgi:hypothetical protein
MFKTTLRRFAATAFAAAAITTATAASATGDFRGFDRPHNNPGSTPANTNPGSAIPGFKNPLAPKTNPAVDPRRVWVGVWKIALKNGKHIAVKFDAKGRFFLIHSDRRHVIEVGFWKVRNGRLVMLPVGECLRKNMKRCRKFDQRKTVQVTFRIVNHDRIDAPAGSFIRRRSA